MRGYGVHRGSDGSDRPFYEMRNGRKAGKRAVPGRIFRPRGCPCLVSRCILFPGDST